MSGSYRQCGQCGRRALSFATRCPGCGVALPDPAPFGDHGSRRRDWSRSLNGVVVVVGVVAIVAMIALVERGPARPALLSAETSKGAMPLTETATITAASATSAVSAS